MYDICALGELLIDFTPAGCSANGRDIFEKNPGGAPANVLAACAKLGGSSTFIGKVGADQFGFYLKQVLEDNKVDTSGLVFSKEVNTTLAFVHLSENGDRSFSFYRKPGADIMLAPEDLNLELIDNSKIFHIGSLSMTDEPSRSATIRALDYAKERGKLISYDPNLRLALWKNENTAKECILSVLSYADILKLSECELEFLTGKTDLSHGTELLAEAGAKIIVVTLGEKGCFFKYKHGNGYVSTYDTKVVDTTGAGDAFLGGLLYRISSSGYALEEIPFEAFRKIVLFSNAVGAICASGFGAIPSMPLLEEVERCMKNTPLLVY
ncbi:MAG: PfkB family carbohydrate kinase [Clostridia bacterium]|nr:PfkB family carbohydrate kinase [Clostridia bacterium]